MNENIQIVIADDHPIMRKGLRTLIESEPGFHVIGEASDGEEAVRLASDLRPDVILMDLVMPHKDGIAAISQISQGHPEIKLLVLTSFCDDDKVFPAIKAGASGYLLKDSTPDELLKSIQDVYAGRPSLHPSIAVKLMRELNGRPKVQETEEPLTEREVEILKMVAQGMNNQQIARSLVISERTVSTHISNILNKLHLANRTQAALYALREGLNDLPRHAFPNR